MDTPDSPAQETGSRVQEAIALQRGWYGEPLGDLFRRLIADLGLNNQVRLAGVLGLSAPMLSQLMSGQRAKIGNPAVVQRLQMLQELAWEVAEGRTGAVDAGTRMEKIRSWSGTSVLNTSHSTSHKIAAAAAAGTVAPRDVVHGIQAVLRSVASADEISDAARTLAPVHPHLAEFLRVYGTGRTGDALDHYKAHQD
jgi:hypothetical protein